jgi:hypothetical protein
MELLVLGVFLFLISFIWNWIKVKIYLISFKMDNNSFLMTITYMMSKKDIKTLLNDQ